MSKRGDGSDTHGRATILCECEYAQVRCDGVRDGEAEHLFDLKYTSSRSEEQTTAMGGTRWSALMPAEELGEQCAPAHLDGRDEGGLEEMSALSGNSRDASEK